MSERDLQRLTNSVDDIDHGPIPRRALPSRRNHITQKIKVAGQRTLYISVHDDEQPAEIFLRLKGADCSSELIGLYDVIARLMSLALQYGAPLEKVGDLLADAKFACGPVSGHDRQPSDGHRTNIYLRKPQIKLSNAKRNSWPGRK